MDIIARTSGSGTPSAVSSQEWQASRSKGTRSPADGASASARADPPSSSVPRVAQPSLRSSATPPPHRRTGPSSDSGYPANSGIGLPGPTQTPPAETPRDAPDGTRHRSREATRTQDAHPAHAVVFEAQAVPDREPDAFERALRERAKHLMHREGTQTRWHRPESARIRGSTQQPALPDAGRPPHGLSGPTHEGALPLQRRRRVVMLKQML